MKQIHIYTILFTCMLAGLSACKKDKDENIVPNIEGVWKQLSNSGEEIYYVFKADKSLYTLRNDAQYNNHSVQREIYKLEGDKLLIAGNYLYNIRTNGDTLVLQTNPNAGTYYIRENNVTLENWVTAVQPEQVMFGLFSNSLCFDGFELVSAENSHYLYSKLTFINPVAKYITHTVAATESYNGLEHAAGRFWATKDNDERIYAINGVDGSLLSASPQAPVDLYSLATDGTDIYCTGISGNKIYKYNTNTATFNTGEPIFYTTIRDMAYRSGHLYLVSDKAVYKCTYSPFNVVKTYYFEDYYLSGIAFDGSGNAWLLGDDGTEDYLLKATLN